MNDRFLAAVVIVLVLWAVQYLVWIRPRDPAVIARKRAREEVRLARIRAAAVPAPVAAQPPPAGRREQTDESEGGASHA